MSWENAWKNEGFDIKKEPSQIALLIEPQIPRNAHVLDLGCGQGRNAFFFAEKGHAVDAVDIVDLGVGNDFPTITFHHDNVVEKEYPSEFYDACIMARLIQYISPSELNLLFQKVYGALKPGAQLGVSFTTNSPILLGKLYSVTTHMHSFSEIETLLSSNSFRIISHQKTIGQSDIPKVGIVDGFDVRAKKE